MITLRRRFVGFVLVFLACCGFLYTHPPLLWRTREYGGQVEGLDHDIVQTPSTSPAEHAFRAGKPKAPGAEYSRAIVMASMKSHNTSWVDESLSDILEPSGPFQKVVYIADDRSAPHHPIKNKGHEVMIYLSYIIDYYDKLPDISIFVHSDRWTWHNNEVMDNDLAGMIRHLSPERVVREGYVNLRCGWEPGCPDWLHPKDVRETGAQKHEEKVLSERWKELFPMEEMPEVLSQPCCAQFALSRERIRSISMSRYYYLRSWILRTNIDDYRSGRVFEYIWQFIFTGQGVVCPDMYVCYCDGYGICFDGKKGYDEFFDLRYSRSVAQRQIRLLKGESPDGDVTKEGVFMGGDQVESTDKSLEQLQVEFQDLEAKMQTLKDEAFIRGRSAQVRARAAGRKWKKGDGF